MFLALLNYIKAIYEVEPRLISACVFSVDNVVRQMSKLIDQPLTVHLVENTTSVVIPIQTCIKATCSSVQCNILNSTARGTEICKRTTDKASL